MDDGSKSIKKMTGGLEEKRRENEKPRGGLEGSNDDEK